MYLQKHIIRQGQEEEEREAKKDRYLC